MALEDWWSAGTAPLLVIQGLDDMAAPPGNGHALREQFGERVRLIDLPRAGHFLLLSSPKPLPAPLPSLSAPTQDLADGSRGNNRISMSE
jgi:pimeloyl-ACP methyl ester carboxylesterase